MRILSLTGLRSYKEVHALQHALLEQRIRDEIPDTLLSLEHSDVITRGRGLQRPAKELQRSSTEETEARAMPLLSVPQGFEYAEIERGGDLTYHGPGQWVLYPIVKLGSPEGRFPKRDVDAYLRELESWLMSLIRGFELEPRRVPDASGVWVGDRKIASIGISVKKWVAYHGIALNVTTDLKKFNAISPCGFQPEVMARLRDLAPKWDSDWDQSWRDHLELKLQEILGVNQIQIQQQVEASSVIPLRPRKNGNDLQPAP